MKMTRKLSPPPPKTKKRAVLITGATGFIGTHLLQKLILDDRYQVLVFSRQKSPALGRYAGKVTVISGDIVNREAVEQAVSRAEIIVHLAASVSSTDRKRNQEVNVEGTKNIIAAAKKYGVKRIVFTSTVLAGLENPCHYGWTKRQAEELLRQSGLEVTILRFCLVYGAGSNGFAKMIKNVTAIPGLIPIIGFGKHHNQPVYVDDVIAALITCLSLENTIGKTYTLAGPSALESKEILKSIAGQLQLRKIFVPLPKVLWLAVGLLAERLLAQPPLTKRDVTSMGRDIQANIQEAAQDLHFNPVAFPDGVALAFQEMAKQK